MLSSIKRYYDQEDEQNFRQLIKEGVDNYSYYFDTFSEMNNDEEAKSKKGIVDYIVEDLETIPEKLRFYFEESKDKKLKDKPLYVLNHTKEGNYIWTTIDLLRNEC